MDREEHTQRHKDLHKYLDELMADMIQHTRMLPSKTTVIELAEWAYQQAENPTEDEVNA